MKIGIDLGGTKIEVVVLQNNSSDEYHEVYRRRCDTPQGQYQQTLTAICNLINDAESHFNQQATIGIGIPGAISAQTKLVKNANSTCLIGKPLQYDLELKLNRPIRINNDANCMTISEATNGAAKNEESVFGVILGTGVGGGIAINQQVLSGKNLIAGEWGHNPLPNFVSSNTSPQLEILSHSIACYCGKKNCIETFLSGPGFIKRFQLAGGKANDMKELLLQAQSGLELAEQYLVQYEQLLAMSLASIINIIDPDMIVLAGGLSNIERFYENVPHYWSDYIFSDNICTKLAPALHGDSSGVFGAALLW